MSDLSRLVEDLHLRDDGDQGSNRPGTQEETLLRHSIQGLLGRKPVGNLKPQYNPFGHAFSPGLDLRNSDSHIEDLQLRLLDPTSHVVPYPPLDLDTRIATGLGFQRDKSNCEVQRVVSIKNRSIGSNSARLAGIHYSLLPVHLSACCEYESTDFT